MSLSFPSQLLLPHNLPLIELRVEVFLLHAGLPFGGSALVWEKDEGDVGVGSIFGAGSQVSVHKQTSQTEVFTIWRQTVQGTQI